MMALDDAGGSMCEARFALLSIAETQERVLHLVESIAQEAKSCDWTNTWYCYEPSHLSIIAGQPQHLAVEVRNLSPDSVARLEQRFYGGCNCWPSIGQLRGAHGKYVHLCPADDEPKILEEPADLILNIPLDLDKQSSADKQGFDRMTVEIFDADFLVPSALHDACDAHRVRSLLSICIFRAAAVGLASMQE